MICRTTLFIATLGLTVSATAVARTASDGFSPTIRSGGSELPPYLQCVPYARERSGIQIYGDAHTWWGQAASRFDRGDKPKVGAVMAFAPSGNMLLGHVAVVSKIIDNRTLLIDHANWSPINGRRGQVELGVRAVDVSPRNDWSEVKVWYAPSQNIGGNAYPVHGFIYAGKASKKNLLIAADRASKRSAAPTQMAAYSVPKASPTYKPVPAPAPALKATSREFSQAFADLAPPPRVNYSAALLPVLSKAPTQIAALSPKPAAKAGGKKPSLAQPTIAPQAKPPVQVARVSVAPVQLARANSTGNQGPAWPQSMTGPGGKAKAAASAGMGAANTTARTKPVNLLASLVKRP